MASWRDWTTLQFSDFFRMRLMAQKAGLWLDADVLLLKPVEIDPAKPYFAWERPRQLGNSVLYLPAGRSDRVGLPRPDGTGGAGAGLARRCAIASCSRCADCGGSHEPGRKSSRCHLMARPH